MRNIGINIVDPQNDFCLKDAPLEIPGAIKDVFRISELISKYGSYINTIDVSLDMHNRGHIDNASSWLTSGMDTLDPFSIIAYVEIVYELVNYKYNKRDFVSKYFNYKYNYEMEICEKYNFDCLPDLFEYENVLYPDHCIVGTMGSNIVTYLQRELYKFEFEHMNNVHYIVKGLNPYTSHMGMDAAYVKYEDDPSTDINIIYNNNLLKNDVVVFCGEAASHCLKDTVIDAIMAYDNIKKPIKDSLFILTDCTSPVSGYEDKWNNYCNKFKELGVTLITSKEFGDLICS